MDSKSEQFEKLSGNIHTESFTTIDTKGYQASKWFLTYHIRNGETFEQGFNSCKSVGDLCDKYIFGEEYGKEGKTPHIQGAFILKGKTKMRATTIAKLFKNGATLRKLKNWNCAFQYCQKEGNNILTNCKIKKPLKTLKEEQLYNWEHTIINIIKQEPDDRTIIWCWDEDKCGTGKTTFCKYLIRNHDAIVLGGKSSDMKNGILDYMKNNELNTPELILVNLPRTFNTDYLSYTGIEECKDMMFYSGKYEGGMVDGNCPHLIIFSNQLPDDMDGIDGRRWRFFNINENKFYDAKGIITFD